MKNITISYFLILIIIFIGCRSNKQSSVVPNTSTSDSKKIGFNQNFSMMPNMTETLYKNISLLKPQILRYPGGTVTHSWNWQEGIIESRASKSVHLINEIKTLVDKTGAEFVFVLDILNKPLSDQIAMLSAIEKLGVKISFIELGNELYAQETEYKEVFNTGSDYAKKVNLWVPELKKRFPNAKIAALLLGRKVQPGNTRMFNWNRLVVDNTIEKVDAFTYHFYIGESSTFLSEKSEFEEITKTANTLEKELWFTEYGNQKAKTHPDYYTELSTLANYLESFPKAKLILNHQIIGGTKNKITEDGLSFDEEGKLFLNRVK